MKLGLLFALLISSLVLPSLAFAEQGTEPVEIDGKTYEVNYDATGLTVDGLEADTFMSTLTVFVTTIDVAPSLEITLERSFFDSRTDGVDEDFLVLTDSEEAVFEEEKTDSARTLTITIPDGANSVDIISFGTTSFGTLEETPEEMPEEIPEETDETPTEEPEEETETPEPTTQCGPGTILKDGACVLETMAEPEPEEETETPEPTTQCGPGTILKDGACVLDERCGPGTIFKDGQCVLDETSAEPSAPRSVTYDLVAPAVAAFVIAFIVMIILWAIGRASRKKTNA
ncbi:MAG: hypothetical protein ACT4NT_05835 [Nitrososphaerota archaeon]